MYAYALLTTPFLFIIAENTNISNYQWLGIKVHIFHYFLKIQLEL